MIPRFDRIECFESELDPMSVTFRRNVLELNQLGRGISRLWEVPRSAPAWIHEEYDFLAEPVVSPTSWSGLNWHMMRSARPDRKAAVVTSVRNEGPYLVEWIAHHLAVGFEELFIYANDNDDGSDPLLDLLHRERLITLIRSQVGEGVSPQKKAFEHAVHFLRQLRRYEWVAFLDMDEMFIPDQRYDFNVLKFLEAFRRAKPDDPACAILVHWDWFFGENRVVRKPGLVIERFTRRADYKTVKSIVHLPTISHMHHVHTPDLDLPFVNSRFDPATVNPWRSEPLCYDGAKINHYFHKSFQEFAVKCMRGIGDTSVRTLGRPLSAYFTFEPKWESSMRVFDHELLDRVKRKIAEINGIEGVTEMVDASSRKHLELADALTSGDIEGAFVKAKAEAFSQGHQR